MRRESIGIIELSSVAQGFLVADAMLKEADVELLLSRSICSGKYMVLIGGEVGNVRRAIDRGITVADYCLIDKFVIPNIHPSVLPAIRGLTTPKIKEALGIIESFSVSSLIEATDAIAKTAEVELIDIRLAMALGGKAFSTFTGSLNAVESAMNAGVDVVAGKGLLTNKVVIPNPREEVYREII